MILIDTDVAIDFLRGQGPGAALFRQLHQQGEQLGVSSVTAAELLRGAGGKGRPRAAALHAHDLIDSLIEVPFGPRAARRFGDLMAALDRAGTPLPALDGMISACALEAGARLATRNMRHFDRVPGLEVLTP